MLRLDKCLDLLLGHCADMEVAYNIQVPDRDSQESEIRVYKRRWYVLIIYNIYSCTQSAVWNTWGPISTSCIDAFGWQNDTIFLMNIWGSVPYIFIGLLLMWFLQVKGLRWAIVTSMFCVAVGTAFRVITSDPRTATILIHIGQFINGVAGPTSSIAIPVMSATWFPQNERVTATALSNSLNIFGSGLAFILGPVLVPDVPLNKLSLRRRFILFQFLDVSSNVMDQTNVTIIRREREKDEIMRYMYYVCGWAVFLFVVIVCYFPSRPPLPPCVSAAVERQPFCAGLLSLRTKRYFIIVAVLFGVSTGVFGGWTSVLNINLSAVDVNEKTAGWMGFYSTVSGCVGSFLVGRLANRFVRYLKVFILVMYIMATAALVMFSLMLIHVVPCTVVGLYVTIITATTSINIAVPLLYELSCELAYPTAEGTASGVMMVFSNFWAVLFFCVLTIPNVGTMWINWVVVASTAVCIPLIAVLGGQMNRLDDDVAVQPVDDDPVQFRDEDRLLA